MHTPDLSRYGSLLISVAIHAAIFLIAGSVIIYRAVTVPRPPLTVQTPGPKLRPRSLQHQLLCKKSLSFQSPPREARRLAARLPEASLDQRPAPPLSLPPPPLQGAASQDSPLLLSSAALGLSASLGQGPGGDPGFGEIEFLGQKVAARSVILLVDSSASIVQKGVFEAVRKEAGRMVSLFHPDTLFNVILYTDGAFAFGTNLVFATTREKNRLEAWLQKEMRINRGNNPDTSGSTPIVALETALKQKPDVIFLISDDPPYLKGEEEAAHERRLLEMIDRARRDKQVQINTIAYKPDLEASPKRREKAERGLAFLKRLASHGNGEFRAVE